MIVQTGHVGAWRVDVTPTDAYAYKYRDGIYLLVARTNVTRFPVGYRIGKVWSAHIPQTVKTTADRLATRLTEGSEP